MNTISNEKRYYTLAFQLAMATIIIALIEALTSTYFGYQDQSLTLLGFGIDSYIEVISSIAVAYMIIRIKKNPNTHKHQFEKIALYVTGYGFYALVIGLIITSLYNIYTKHKPNTTVSGLIIAIISIVLMWILGYRKTKVGKKLNSNAILADAECTRICIYMSIVLLISSAIYELTHFIYIDSIGTLGLAYFSFKEGKECFEKAVSDNHNCSC